MIPPQSPTIPHFPPLDARHTRCRDGRNDQLVAIRLLAAATAGCLDRRARQYSICTRLPTARPGWGRLGGRVDEGYPDGVVTFRRGGRRRGGRAAHRRQHRAGHRRQGGHDPPRTHRPARRGPSADRGRARRRQDEVRQGTRALHRLHRAARAVHAGPAAERHHRRQRLQRRVPGLRVQAGPGVRQHRRRRRDQPGFAEDSGGAAGVHGGTPGHRRRR